jgi:hypothetical protein
VRHPPLVVRLICTKGSIRRSTRRCFAISIGLRLGNRVEQRWRHVSFHFENQVNAQYLAHLSCGNIIEPLRSEHNERAGVASAVRRVKLQNTAQVAVVTEAKAGWQRRERSTLMPASSVSDVDARTISNSTPLEALPGYKHTQLHGLASLENP